jgi:hypothetical protein
MKRELKKRIIHAVTTPEKTKGPASYFPSIVKK